MATPNPTPLYRFLHIDNLRTCLARRALHAPNHAPADGLDYKTIHNIDVQKKRRVASVDCGPGGVIHDYVPFYFGYLSPMLLQLKTGQVADYNEGQEPLIYLVAHAQDIERAQLKYVFSDGHGIAFNTSWYCRLAELDEVDWNMVYQKYWAANYEGDIDRQRRKQAEFLVYKECGWNLIHELGVINAEVQLRVENILAEYPPALRKPVNIHPEWYY